MVVAQCICPSRAHKDESKEPLPHAGWDELLVVCLMSALIAVTTWEFGRWMYRKARRALKRRRKARQLDDVSRLASRAARQEIAKEEAGSQLRCRAAPRQAPERLDYEDLFEAGSSSTTSRRPTSAARLTTPPRATTSSRPTRSSVGTSPTRPATPPLRPQSQEPMTAMTASPIPRSSFFEEQERRRVCHDVLALMVCEDLRAALRHEGLAVSGLKEDLIVRLVPVLHTGSSTSRQLKYVLYIWRTRSLDYRCKLLWNDINDRGRISLWTARWKEA